MGSAPQASPNVTEKTAGPLVVGTSRLNSVDLLRGLVMAIMALDHVRDYFTHLQFAPEDLRFTWGTLFFTRWITHFCAPCFFFLAGTGAFLSRKKGAELASFLWKRGLWLVFLELTVIGVAWTFLPAPGYGGVIWALGWSMVILSVLVRLPVRMVGAIGVATIVLHNLLDPVQIASFGRFGWAWIILHSPNFIPIAPKIGFIFILYVLIPWFGVMAAGYAFGAVLQQPADKRRKTLLLLGASMTLAFIVLRATNAYGNPPQQLAFASPGDFAVQKTTTLTVIDFFDVEKYPPSLQYLLMTLGPSIMLLALFEKVDLRRGIGRFWEKILVFGRVPMFYYICHLFLIHTMAILSAFAFRQPAAWLWHGAFFAARKPPTYGFNLGYIYLMWLTALVILYFPCKWFAGVKARRKDWWLSYL
jgi:uncharacterized membrane protein